MKRKTKPGGSAVQPKQAQELTTRGESREALISAMNTLLQALQNLRGSLLALQTGLSELQELFPLTPAPVKVAKVPRLDLLKKPRRLH